MSNNNSNKTANTTTTTSKSNSQEELQAALKSRLIQSGEYEKLLGLLKKRLDESGWEDNLRGVAREKARIQEPPNLNGLVKEIEPLALDTVPVAVRTEIEDLLRSFVEKNVEE